MTGHGANSPASQAQYAYNLPWWLILRHPAILMSEGKQEFLRLFEPRKEQFLRAMERAEASSPLTKEPRLSARMRDSWDNDHFWFSMASRGSFDVDDIYWQVLHKEGRGEEMLSKATLDKKEEFLKRKKDQFQAYWDEKQNDVRFTK